MKPAVDFAHQGARIYFFHGDCRSIGLGSALHSKKPSRIKHNKGRVPAKSGVFWEWVIRAVTGFCGSMLSSMDMGADKTFGLCVKRPHARTSFHTLPLYNAYNACNTKAPIRLGMIAHPLKKSRSTIGGLPESTRKSLELLEAGIVETPFV